MRAVAGEAALEVAVDALGQLGGQRLGVRAPSSAAGRRARPRPRGRAPPACSAKRGAQPLDGLARGRPSARCRGGRARRPRPAARPATGAAGADRGEQRVALRERGARTRGACRARAGHSAATTWSRCARRSAGAPSTSSSRSGRKTETSGRAADVGQPLDRRAVDAQALRLARLEADRDLVARRARPRSAAPAASARRRSARTSRSLAVRHERPVQAK